MSLADDFRDDGFLFAHRDLRNYATHRFVVVHDETIGEHRDSKALLHVVRRDLERQCILALHVVRSALI